MFERTPHQLFMLSITQARLLCEGWIRKRRNRAPLFPGLAHRPENGSSKGRQPRNKDQVAVAHAQVEGCIRRRQTGVVMCFPSSPR